MKLKLDMSCHLLNAYTKFQIDISKHVEKKSGKLGRTDIAIALYVRFSNGRIKTRWVDGTATSEVNPVTIW